ncbi:AraC family transcriptional regulator [Fibrella sp. HMF5036]|uniref:AraC family transcriptional regulator n=2 Tax=Fibrella aquatilis TaxID=2817059 RepID=A0A939G8N3_9BACT|nr:helix-turn-helix domain-containing protein [Fibrella aquatilis]MBO0933020.1 AraC family transcriptional regulator [Fibrella aquatilis]
MAIGFECTPTGLQTLWQLPVGELSEQSLDVTAVANRGVRELTDRLREARSTAQRFALLEQFLLRQLARANWSKHLATDGRIEAAVAAIQHDPAQINLQQLAHYLNTSERTLRRRFAEVVGVSPKYYVRMQRFILARHWLARQPQPNWQDILTLTGHYDQAHLINEFRYFIGTSPGQFTSQPAGMHDFIYQ